MAPNTSVVMPKTLFVITADRKKPYKLLDAKYMMLFDRYMREFLTFKEQELRNFEKSTGMLLALGLELGVVKKVVE